MNKIIYTAAHKQIVQKLKKARIQKGLSQVEVALSLNKTQSYISKIESGQRRIDITILKKFAEIYQIDINNII